GLVGELEERRRRGAGEVGIEAREGVEAVEEETGEIAVVTRRAGIREGVVERPTIACREREGRKLLRSQGELRLARQGAKECQRRLLLLGLDLLFAGFAAALLRSVEPSEDLRDLIRGQ